jgi:hypothetical protein
VFLNGFFRWQSENFKSEGWGWGDYRSLMAATSLILKTMFKSYNLSKTPFHVYTPLHPELSVQDHVFNCVKNKLYKLVTQF